MSYWLDNNIAGLPGGMCVFITELTQIPLDGTAMQALAKQSKQSLTSSHMI